MHRSRQPNLILSFCLLFTLWVMNACESQFRSSGQYSETERPAIEPQTGSRPTSPHKSKLKKAYSQRKLTKQSKLAIDGIGPVEIGMTVAQASQVAGVQLVPLDPNASPLCSDYKPLTGLEGVRFIITDEGRISRVDIDSDQITTVQGARIGDTESHIKLLYPRQIQVSPLPNSAKGHYLVVSPDKSDSNLRLIFETDGQRVQRMRVGKLPEVAFVGGCSDIRPGL